MAKFKKIKNDWNRFISSTLTPYICSMTPLVRPGCTHIFYRKLTFAFNGDVIIKLVKGAAKPLLQYEKKYRITEKWIGELIKYKQMTNDIETPQIFTKIINDFDGRRISFSAGLMRWK